MFDNYDRSKYEKGALSLLQENIIIFVEGKSNKLFYSKFKEIQHISIITPLDNNLGSNSCNNIKELVKENSNWHAILDRDFNDLDTVNNRVYYLDYYSIENIVLENHSDFQDIKKNIEIFINKKGLSNCLTEMYTISIDRENKTYTITKLQNIESQYSTYINVKIKNLSCYIKYMPVKRLIRSFDSFLTTKNKGYKKNRYLQNLYNELSNKLLLNLFSNTTDKHFDALKLLLRTE